MGSQDRSDAIEVLVRESVEDSFNVDRHALALGQLTELMTGLVSATRETNASMHLALGTLQSHASAADQKIKELESAVASLRDDQRLLEAGLHGDGRLGRHLASEIGARIRAIATLEFPQEQAQWRGARQRVDLEVRRRAKVSYRVRWEDVEAGRAGAIGAAIDAARKGVIERLREKRTPVSVEDVASPDHGEEQ